MLLGEFKEYRGLKGTIEVNLEKHFYYGKVLGIDSLITYEAKDVVNLYVDYCDAIDEYLGFEED